MILMKSMVTMAGLGEEEMQLSVPQLKVNSI